MITPSSFKVRFPEFACITEERIQLFIDDSVVILNEAYWGTKYDLGLYYLSAHSLYMASNTEDGNIVTSGPIASRAVDGVSVSYAVSSSDDVSDNYYRYTRYGQRYISLRKTLGVPAAVV